VALSLCAVTTLQDFCSSPSFTVARQDRGEFPSWAALALHDHSRVFNQPLCLEVPPQSDLQRGIVTGYAV